MSITPYADFAGRDYTATFERLLALLQTEVPLLTDLNHSDAGISLLRLLARESDQLAFYLDEAFQEGFIELCRYKQSLLDLAKLVGYPPKLAATASVTLTLTRASGTGDIPIPQYSAFSRSDGITYLTTEAVTLLDGNDTITVEAQEGTLVELTLETDDFDVVDRSESYKYNLGAGVAAYTLTMEHDDPAVEWSEVESFWRSQTTDYHFLLELYADKWNEVPDTVFLVVGPCGVPADDMTVKFIRTSGADGNCGYGTITGVPGALTGQITCTNAASATGGAATETIEQLRERIPRVTRTQRRAVTTYDYEALVESISGVLHCQAIDRNWGSEWPHMYVTLFVVPDGGGPMSTILENLIHTELGEWGHLGDWDERYLLFDATEDAVAVTAKIGIETGHTPATVKSNVETALAAFFEPENLDIGETVTFLDVYQTVTGVAGVAWVQFTTPTSDVTVDDGHIAVAGTLTITY